MVLVGLVVVFGLPPLLGFAGLVAWIGRRHLGAARSVAGGLALVALTTTCAIISLPLGSLLTDRDARSAQAFCEGLVAGLEEYRGSHGEFPADVDQAEPAREELPRLLRDVRFYSSSGQAFSFRIPDPRGFAWWEYQSTSREWKHVQVD